MNALSCAVHSCCPWSALTWTGGCALTPAVTWSTLRTIRPPLSGCQWAGGGAFGPEGPARCWW